MRDERRRRGKRETSDERRAAAERSRTKREKVGFGDRVRDGLIKELRGGVDPAIAKSLLEQAGEGRWERRTRAAEGVIGWVRYAVEHRAVRSRRHSGTMESGAGGIRWP